MSFVPVTGPASFRLAVTSQGTIALINEMRKGNQEGAARIVSGLNQ